jgi:hypothetical protein
MVILLRFGRMRLLLSGTGSVEWHAIARTAFLSEEDGSVAFLLLPLHHLGELSEELS